MILSTRDTRTLVPVTVVLKNSREPASVLVKGSQDFFQVALKRKNDFFQGEFWLEKPGVYDVTARDAQGTKTESLVVRDQVFLSFGIEFGIFLSALTLAAMGVIVWHKRRAKFHKG